MPAGPQTVTYEEDAPSAVSMMEKGWDLQDSITISAAYGDQALSVNDGMDGLIRLARGRRVAHRIQVCEYYRARESVR